MPLNLGLVGAGGSAGAVDALQEIIKRRFLEQQQAQNYEIDKERNAIAAGAAGTTTRRLAFDQSQAEQKIADQKAQRDQMLAAYNDPNTSPEEKTLLRANLDYLDIKNVKDLQRTPPPRFELKGQLGPDGKTPVTQIWNAETNKMDLVSPEYEKPESPEEAALRHENLIAARARNAPMDPKDVASEIRTTASGRQYVTSENFRIEELPKLRAAAHEYENPDGTKGVPLISNKAWVGKLIEIDNAKSTQQALLDQIEPYLPHDEFNRIVESPEIKLSELLQYEPVRAAFGAWQTSAINILKAIAGGSGSGLRINRDEIKRSVENDNPLLTDTVATALQRVRNISVQLNKIEEAIFNSPNPEDAKNETTKPPPEPEPIPVDRAADGRLVAAPAPAAKPPAGGIPSPSSVGIGGTVRGPGVSLSPPPGAGGGAVPPPGAGEPEPIMVDRGPGGRLVAVPSGVLRPTPPPASSSSPTRARLMSAPRPAATLPPPRTVSTLDELERLIPSRPFPGSQPLPSSVKTGGAVSRGPGVSPADLTRNAIVGRLAATPPPAAPAAPAPAVEFQNKLENVIKAVQAETGLSLKVISGQRTADEQAREYARGRSAPGRVVTPADGTRVTSQHQTGEAADLQWVDKSGRVVKPTKALLDALGRIAAAQGLVWGGTFSTPDPGHLQMRARSGGR